MGVPSAIVNESFEAQLISWKVAIRQTCRRRVSKAVRKAVMAKRGQPSAHLPYG